MNELKEKPADVLRQTKADARRAARGPTNRTILIAAAVGVLIGLLLKR